MDLEVTITQICLIDISAIRNHIFDKIQLNFLFHSFEDLKCLYKTCHGILSTPKYEWYMDICLPNRYSVIKLLFIPNIFVSQIIYRCYWNWIPRNNQCIHAGLRICQWKLKSLYCLAFYEAVFPQNKARKVERKRHIQIKVHRTKKSLQRCVSTG